MTCPICKQNGARRSRRHSLADYVVSMLGILPWRCRECHARFHARLMPLSDALHAHCPHCGNMELQRISPEYVGSSLASDVGFAGGSLVPLRPMPPQVFFPVAATSSIEADSFPRRFPRRAGFPFSPLLVYIWQLMNLLSRIAPLSSVTPAYPHLASVASSTSAS